MRRFSLWILILLLWMPAVGIAAEDSPPTPVLSEEDRKVAELMDLLELMELLDNLEAIVALEEDS